MKTKATRHLELVRMYPRRDDNKVEPMAASLVTIAVIAFCVIELSLILAAWIN